LLEKAFSKNGARVLMCARGSGHAACGRVEMRVNPGITAVEPDLPVPLVSPT
jgi:hypothetical protein